MAHTQALEDISYATPDRNRFVGSLGHNNTVQYIVDQLEALDGYYNVELQPFNTTLQVDSAVTFVSTIGNFTSEAFTYSSSVSLTDTAIVPVSNLGCSAVGNTVMNHDTPGSRYLTVFEANIKLGGLPLHRLGLYRPHLPR